MTPSSLSLVNFWQKQLTPALPLLADISHLSIYQVQQALSHFLKAVTLQLHSLLTSGTQSHATPLVAELKSGELPQLSLSILAQLMTDNGLNFTQIPNIAPFVQTAQAYLFSDTFVYHQLVGVLAQRTNLAPQYIQPLLGWITLLILISLYQLLSQPAVENHQWYSWLDAQPEIGFDKNDIGLLTIFNRQYYANTASRFEQFHAFSKQKIWEILASPSHFQLFALAPSPTQPFSQASSSVTSEQSSFSTLPAAPTVTAPSIFTPNNLATHPPFGLAVIKLLQQYWIVTGMVLTGLVFAGVLVFIPSSPKSGTAETLAPTQKPIHDVAILKVASSAEVTSVTHSATSNAKVNAAAPPKSNTISKQKIESPLKNSSESSTKASKLAPTASSTTPQQKSNSQKSNKAIVTKAEANKPTRKKSP